MAGLFIDNNDNYIKQNFIKMNTAAAARPAGLPWNAPSYSVTVGLLRGYY